MVTRQSLPTFIIIRHFSSFTSKNGRLKKLAIVLEAIYNADMHNRSSKKKLDFNELAKSILDKATIDEVLTKAAQEGKNPAAVLLGRMGGLKGGKARAESLSVEERSEIAQRAAKARWSAKS